MRAPTQHALLTDKCLCSKEWVVTMLLERAHPKLLQAALLTAALTPERQTAATGIFASSSVAIS